MMDRLDAIVKMWGAIKENPLSENYTSTYGNLDSEIDHLLKNIIDKYEYHDDEFKVSNIVKVTVTNRR